MKENLFDHIVINSDSVEFGLCRKMTILENFFSGVFGNVIKYGNTIYISPTNFKEFLRCLQKTELSKNLDFRIREEFGKTWYETTLKCLLNHFIECTCRKHSQSQKELVLFFNSADEILNNKIKEQQILKNIPKEYIK